MAVARYEVDHAQQEEQNGKRHGDCDEQAVFARGWFGLAGHGAGRVR